MEEIVKSILFFRKEITDDRVGNNDQGVRSHRISRSDPNILQSTLTVKECRKCPVRNNKDNERKKDPHHLHKEIDTFVVDLDKLEGRKLNPEHACKK